MSRKHLGELGETIASEYLVDKGYQLLRSNWRTSMGELDLIMLSPDGLFVVIEVKLRTNRRMGHGVESIDTRKLHQIYRMTELFLLKHPQYRHLPLRIDVISVECDKALETPPALTHIEGVY